MPAPKETLTVVLDATVVIHLAQADRLDLLGAMEGYVFVVPDQVVEEVIYPEQAAILEQALEAGHLRRESSTEPAEIALYAELRRRMGKGEAACLAMSVRRDWMLASDDRGRAFRRIVRERLGTARLIDTSAIVKMALEGGVISADEAEQIGLPRDEW